MDQKTIDTYNELARAYDEETADFWEKFPRTVIDKFAQLAGGKILDVGSGPGRDALLLQEAGLEVLCLDASEEMVKIAEERGLNALVGDFLNVPFEDNMFGGVWAYTAFLHVPKKDIDHALREAYRVLKPGAILGLGLIEGEGEYYRESSGVGKPRLFSFYTKEEIEELLAKHDFEIVYFEGFTPATKTYLNFLCRKRG